MSTELDRWHCWNITPADVTGSEEIHQRLVFKNHCWRTALSQGISNAEREGAASVAFFWCEATFAVDGSNPSLHMPLNVYLGNGFCHFSAKSQKGDMCSTGEKPVGVKAIALAIATCQIEQIEFVFLRWLVGALNSILVVRLIKAVKANVFGCEPGESHQPPDDSTCLTCVVHAQC